MFADIAGGRIHYESAGDGIPVVFVHGLGGTGNVWYAQRAALSKFFRIVTIDLPGSGQSDRGDKNFSMDRWSDQLRGLADALQLGRFVLVGHSMSTILAQKFAARHGERLLGLVLCGPLTELPPAGKEAFVSALQRYMAICRGIATDFELLFDFSSDTLSE